MAMKAITWKEITGYQDSIEGLVRYYRHSQTIIVMGHFILTSSILESCSSVCLGPSLTPKVPNVWLPKQKGKHTSHFIVDKQGLDRNPDCSFHLLKLRDF